jgi:hypothetical protein
VSILLDYRRPGLFRRRPPRYAGRMRHPIDPKIDCIFKALLGSEDHKHLLVHFLNAMLAAERVQTEEQRWLKFFIEGEHLDPADPPTWMQTPEMQQIMTIVKQFSEKDRAYHAYQARQNYLRQQQSIARHIQALEAERVRERAAKEQALASQQRERAEKERERAAKEQALASEQREREEKEAALAEIARLKALLNDPGAR